MRKKIDPFEVSSVFMDLESIAGTAKKLKVSEDTIKRKLRIVLDDLEMEINELECEAEAIKDALRRK